MARRWFQFSLRGFLIALTVFAVWLGWTVERTRKRGVAIDAIVQARGNVFYAGDLQLNVLDDSQHLGHFWSDLRRMPVEIYFHERTNLDAFMGKCIRDAAPIRRLEVWHPIYDDALVHLDGLSDGCE